ncbi:MAG TPA: hypothetical protein VI855_05895 [Dehalococcoidia bacterium]|nr:hypothetical protein [Dehalococcoidia bacterium]
MPHMIRWPVFLVLIVALAAWLAGCGSAAPGQGSTPTTPPSPQDSVPAPIESVNLEYGVGTPPQSFLVIVSGLPDGCTTFGGYTISRQGDVFRVEVTNRKPTTPGLMCTQIYGLVTTRIPLEGEIKPCRVYTVVVNDQEYRVQAIGPAIRCSPPPASSGTTTPSYGDGVELRLRVGESQPVGASGLVITLVGVPEDSRCPRSVVCVWAGQAAVVIGATLPGADQGTFRLVLGPGAASTAVAVAGYQVRLVNLEPYPASPGAIPVGDYLAVLSVAKS